MIKYEETHNINLVFNSSSDLYKALELLDKNNIKYRVEHLSDTNWNQASLIVNEII